MRLVRWRGRHFHRRTRKPADPSSPPCARGFPQKKAQWVSDAVLALYENDTRVSHRKLADLFNQLKWVKRVLRWIGVRQRFTRLGSPWENGIVERFLGTFKACVHDYLMRDAAHLTSSLSSFAFWYNVTWPHQHLGGCTPYQVWCGIDPYRSRHQSAHAFSAWNGRLKGMVLRF